MVKTHRDIPFEESFGPLHEIPDDKLYEYLSQNQYKDAAFLAIISSEVLRRQLKHKIAADRFLASKKKSKYTARSSSED